VVWLDSSAITLVGQARGVQRRARPPRSRRARSEAGTALPSWLQELKLLSGSFIGLISSKATPCEAKCEATVARNVPYDRLVRGHQRPGAALVVAGVLLRGAVDEADQVGHAVRGGLLEEVLPGGGPWSSRRSLTWSGSSRPARGPAATPTPPPPMFVPVLTQVSPAVVNSSDATLAWLAVENLARSFTHHAPEAPNPATVCAGAVICATDEASGLEPRAPRRLCVEAGAPATKTAPARVGERERAGQGSGVGRAWEKRRGRGTPRGRETTEGAVGYAGSGHGCSPPLMSDASFRKLPSKCGHCVVAAEYGTVSSAYNTS